MGRRERLHRQLAVAGIEASRRNSAADGWQDGAFRLPGSHEELSGMPTWTYRSPASTSTRSPRWQPAGQPEAPEGNFERNMAKAGRGAWPLRSWPSSCDSGPGRSDPRSLSSDELAFQRREGRDRGVRAERSAPTASLGADRRHLVGRSATSTRRKVVGVGSVGTRAWIVLMLAAMRTTHCSCGSKKRRNRYSSPSSARATRPARAAVVEGRRLVRRPATSCSLDPGRRHR